MNPTFFWSTLIQHTCFHVTLATQHHATCVQTVHVSHAYMENWFVYNLGLFCIFTCWISRRIRKLLVGIRFCIWWKFTWKLVAIYVKGMVVSVNLFSVQIFFLGKAKGLLKQLFALASLIVQAKVWAQRVWWIHWC